MGTQQIPAPPVSAIKHSSAPNFFLAHAGLHVPFVGVVRVGLRFCAYVVDGSARARTKFFMGTPSVTFDGISMRFMVISLMICRNIPFDANDVNLSLEKVGGSIYIAKLLL